MLVIELREFAKEMSEVYPKPAYRLSLDCGILFNAINNFFHSPYLCHQKTLNKIFKSLNVGLVMAVDKNSVLSTENSPRIVIFDPGWVSEILPDSDCRTIKKRRNDLGFSVKNLSKMGGYNQNTGFRMEDGGKTSIRSLQSASIVLGLSLYVVVGEFHSVQYMWDSMCDRMLKSPSAFPDKKRSLKSTCD